MVVPRLAGALALVVLTLPAPVLLAEDSRQVVSEDAAQAHSFFERRYDLNVGDKGEDTFDVSTRRPACGESAWVFDRARVGFLERRFADAQIVTLPEAGCFDCAPLAVRWYHEPTGRLSYQLHVYRRQVTGVCSGARHRR